MSMVSIRCCLRDAEKRTSKLGTGYVADLTTIDEDNPRIIRRKNSGAAICSLRELIGEDDKEIENFFIYVSHPTRLRKLHPDPSLLEMVKHSLRLINNNFRDLPDWTGVHGWSCLLRSCPPSSDILKDLREINGKIERWEAHIIVQRLKTFPDPPVDWIAPFQEAPDLQASDVKYAEALWIYWNRRTGCLRADDKKGPTGAYVLAWQAGEKRGGCDEKTSEAMVWRRRRERHAVWIHTGGTKAAPFEWMALPSHIHFRVANHGRACEAYLVIRIAFTPSVRAAWSVQRTERVPAMRELGQKYGTNFQPKRRDGENERKIIVRKYGWLARIKDIIYSVPPGATVAACQGYQELRDFGGWLPGAT
ncbi:hypothetical protein B0H14DRAFT_2610989 [Mycena olivaceomarginata]|nr:hypothetical protein B0H14DRAFT_2610989 [Mycena olivaceomarginata]